MIRRFLSRARPHVPFVAFAGACVGFLMMAILTAGCASIGIAKSPEQRYFAAKSEYAIALVEVATWCGASVESVNAKRAAGLHDDAADLLAITQGVCGAAYHIDQRFGQATALADIAILAPSSPDRAAIVMRAVNTILELIAELDTVWASAPHDPSAEFLPELDSPYFEEAA